MKMMAAVAATQCAWLASSAPALAGPHVDVSLRHWSKYGPASNGLPDSLNRERFGLTSGLVSLSGLKKIWSGAQCGRFRNGFWPRFPWRRA
jgi:hypothetical protein